MTSRLILKGWHVDSVCEHTPCKLNHCFYFTIPFDKRFPLERTNGLTSVDPIFGEQRNV